MAVPTISRKRDMRSKGFVALDRSLATSSWTSWSSAFNLSQWSFIMSLQAAFKQFDGFSAEVVAVSSPPASSNAKMCVRGVVISSVRLIWLGPRSTNSYLQRYWSNDCSTSCVGWILKSWTWSHAFKVSLTFWVGRLVDERKSPSQKKLTVCKSGC